MLKLILYKTVHGWEGNAVAAIVNPQLFGNLDPVKRLEVLANQLGATEFEILSDIDALTQGELFPRPNLQVIRHERKA